MRNLRKEKDEKEDWFLESELLTRRAVRTVKGVRDERVFKILDFGLES